MALEPAALAYAGTMGAASFFSPCSAGLLPGYIGYQLSHDGRRSAWRGLGLGLSASVGFMLLFGAMALLIHFVPLGRIAPILPYVGLAVGTIIILLGAFLLLGGSLSVPMPQIRPGARNMFLFGVAYAVATLGCTFPLFLSVAFVSVTTGNATMAAFNIIAYGIGMSGVMVMLTTGLSISQTTMANHLKAAIPLVTKLAPIVMIAGGIYILYYWSDILQVNP